MVAFDADDVLFAGISALPGVIPEVCRAAKQELGVLFLDQLSTKFLPRPTCIRV